MNVGVKGVKGVYGVAGLLLPGVVGVEFGSQLLLLAAEDRFWCGLGWLVGLVGFVVKTESGPMEGRRGGSSNSYSSSSGSRATSWSLWWFHSDLGRPASSRE